MSDALVGTLVGGRYRIQRTLGVGGTASVYEAEDSSFGRVVALKVPHGNTEPNSVPAKRLIREARASAAVGHPNVCEVSELGILPNGTPFVVMECLRGETLRDRLERERRLSIADLVDVMMQVLSGLGAAHERGIVHRDIKPENIFLVRRAGCLPLVKILDFGCVTTDTPVRQRPQRGRGAGIAEDLTATGMVVGTPWYLAPEQIRGTRTFDGRVDIYACGVVLYEATTGHRPFNGPNIAALCKDILAASPMPVSSLRTDVPVALNAVIARAMASAASNRFANAAAFQSALADVRVDGAQSRSTGVSHRGGGETLVQSKATTNEPVVAPAAPDEDWDQHADWDQPTIKKPLPTPRRS